MAIAAPNRAGFIAALTAVDQLSEDERRQETKLAAKDTWRHRRLAFYRAEAAYHLAQAEWYLALAGKQQAQDRERACVALITFADSYFALPSGHQGRVPCQGG